MQLAIKSCTRCKRMYCNAKRKRCRTCWEYVAKYQARRWANRVIVHSRVSDKNAKRPFEDHEYITPERLHFLRRLQESKCVYCRTVMQTDNRKRPNGLTIERVNNDVAHLKDNVLLCCYRCNCVGGNGNPGPIIQNCFNELKQKIKVV